MNEETTPIFCALAFGSVNVTPLNKYIPCCSFSSGSVSTKHDQRKGMPPADRINMDLLVGVRRSLLKGEWHPACNLCEREEKLASQSMRQIWNSALKEYDIPMAENVDPINVRFVSIGFSNKCNSKCMTCTPASSNLWNEEYKHIWKNNPTKNSEYDWTISIAANDDKSIEILKSFPNVSHITLLGGEPTILSEHDALISYLIASGRSHDISLTYVTNLTGISDSLIESWKKFKHISIMASIDGFGIVNEYIRYPFKWNKIDTNLRKVFELSKTGSIDIGLSCTASMFNCIGIADVLLYWYNICTEYNQYVSVYINKVVQPSYTATNIMSDSHRAVGIAKLKSLKELLKNCDNLQITIDILIDWLSQPMADDSQIAMSKHFILESDKFRSRSIKDYIPEIWDDLYGQ
jgi:hypothetical protein